VSELQPLFALAESAVVQAGAGTGKTHSLVTLCLHLLGGVGRAEPLPAARLWAVTFTEKAAAELKGRIRERVDALAERPPEEVARIEPELAASGAPPPELWRRVRRDLGAAQVGTIHGLCSQILRRHAAAAGLDPDFAVLDEVDARQLRADACLAAALEALEGTGPLRDAARRLCAELGFRGAGRFGRGLADELSFLLAALGESGREVSEVVDSTPALHAANAVAGEGEARRAFAAALDDLESELRAARLRRAPSPTAIKALSGIEDYRARGAAAVAAAPPGELAQAWRQLRGLRGSLPRSLAGRAGELMRAAREGLETLLEADAQVRSARLSRELALMAAEAQRRYRAEKSRASALDFDDLTRLTRDLLARDLAVRRLEKARLGVLLVDEFQDTSRPQLELFGWLVEDGEGTAPAGSGLPGARPVARGKLVVVGDRKQSIYEFRGADVASAQAFAARALQDGARRFVLRTSRRSLPPLVDFANRLFRTALGAADRPFDTPFLDDDALSAHRAGVPGPCAELLDVLGAGVEAEAEVVSRRIALLLAPGAPERVQDQGGPRPVRGGDVAILLRRFTNVDVFRRALLKRRIPHLVFKGRGFYQAREVLDLTQLLALAVDPDDDLALLSVLRSPLGPLSDDALVLLARHGGRGLSLRAAREPAAREALASDDAEALDRVLGLISRVQRECDRLGPAALLEAVLAESDFLAAIAGGLYGEQAAANVEKLVGFARQHELHGGNVRAFVAQVRRLADDDAGEADAGVVEESDPHAVRLLTVHAAKGLEFPVVVVPECAAQPRGGPEGVLLDPDLGLALKVRGAGWKRWGSHGLAVRDLRKEREAAQGRRLFYVAATRARDLLLLSGRAAPRVETWRQWIDRAMPDCAGLVRVLPDGATGQAEPVSAGGAALVDGDAGLLRAVLRAEAPAGAGPDGAAAALRAAELVARTAGHAGARPRGTVLAPVTQLADASACARRYQLLHELGLEERPHGAGEASAGAGGAAERGTLAHRLLELVPLDLADGAARRRELRRLVELEGEDPDSPEIADVMDAVAAFLDSALARRMARAGARQLFRELPFALRLEAREGEPAGPDLVVRGQLDALLLDGEEATVVDYKLSRAAAAGRYEFQLDAYAVAAQALTGSAVPVRSGLVFLRSPGAPFAAREAPGAAHVEEIRRGLLSAARTVESGRRTGAWPKVEPARCRELECGFFRRCHPEVTVSVAKMARSSGT